MAPYNEIQYKHMNRLICGSKKEPYKILSKFVITLNYAVQQL